jgi:uncharacterized BrkB/YihY/UPF0761 family membrane protein
MIEHLILSVVITMKDIRFSDNHGNDTFYLIVSFSPILIVMLSLSCLEHSESVDQQSHG